MANDQRGSASWAVAGRARASAARIATGARSIYVLPMSEVTDIVIPMLRRLQEDMSNLREDMHNIKVRMTSVEATLAANNRHMDNFGMRLERIERRLDLIEV